MNDIVVARMDASDLPEVCAALPARPAELHRRRVHAQERGGFVCLVARLDGTPFPSTARLASRWLRGRVGSARRAEREAGLETAFCAEVVALTYEEMGLLEPSRDASWYDPGRFWSGDDLLLAQGARLGGEIPVIVPSV